MPSLLEQADPQWLHFLYWLAGVGTVDPFAYKQEHLYRRLLIRREAAACQSWQDFRRYLQRHPGELERLQSSFTVSVSAFFRDPESWQVLACWLARSSGPLRAWSAGCAAGQELYSLAALLAGCNRLSGSRLVGSDCNREAIRQAQEATYRLPSEPHLPAPLLPYLQARPGERFTISPVLRSVVELRHEDLFRGLWQECWQLILCRNLLIYLSVNAQKRLLRRLSRSLEPGGILFIGRSERVGKCHDYALEPLAPGFYLKVDC